MSQLLEANEAQKSDRDHVTYSEWGQKLSLHQFLAREQRLRSGRWTKKAMQTWFWVEPHSKKVLSSCETFSTPSFMRDVPGTSYAFASVFTEEQLRGNGYAAKMIQAVMNEIAVRDHDLQAFTLYSEIGDALYSRLGFSARPSFERVISTTARKSGVSSLVLLSKSDVLTLWSQLKRPNDGFVMWPQAEQIEWHFERELIYATHLGLKEPPYAGARLDGSIIFWMADFKNDSLQVLYLQASSALAGQALLVKASEVAGAAGLPSVRIWEGELFSGWERMGLHAERLPRDGSLAMIRFVNGVTHPSDWNFTSRSLWV